MLIMIASMINKNQSGVRPWWLTAVIYELYVDRFARNFNGLTMKLDYLRQLGVNCLHILPYYPSPMVDDGYDVSDYASIRTGLGTMTDFKKFTNAAHRQGMRVVIDLVLNHTSTDHPWFIDARSSRLSPKRDYYLWSRTGIDFSKSLNALPHLEKHNWIYNSKTRDYYFTTFYPQQADLNWTNPSIFQEMTSIMDFWVARGVDGFRLDAARHMIKKINTSCLNLPETHATLKRLRSHLDTHHPGIILLADTYEPARRSRAYFGNGDECHLVYDFSFAAGALLAAKRLALSQPNYHFEPLPAIPPLCRWVTFLTNHDFIPLDFLPSRSRRELLAWLATPRQYTFNGQQGLVLRLATALKDNAAQLASGFGMLLSQTGVPVIYYGEEISQRNLPRNDTITDTRQYVRGAFDWHLAQKQLRRTDSLFHRVRKMIAARARTTIRR